MVSSVTGAKILSFKPYEISICMLHSQGQKSWYHIEVWYWSAKILEFPVKATQTLAVILSSQGIPQHLQVPIKRMIFYILEIANSLSNITILNANRPNLVIFDGMGPFV